MKLTPAKVTMMMLMAVGGLIGLYVIKGLFAVEKKADPRPRSVTIPLAAGYLAPGTKITDTHIGLGPFPERELKEDHLRSSRVIVGRIVKEAIKPGDPIRGSQLYEPGENAPLEVAAGKQAVSISVKESSEMVDGLIRPGDYVDVYFRLDTQRTVGLDDRLIRLGGVSMTLFKGVKVLALNKGFRQSTPLPTGNSVTLELTAAQTNVLLVAQPNGSISFSYNPNGEGDGQVALSNSDRATLWEILGLKKKVREPKEEPEEPFVTETFRGAGGNSLQWGKDGKRFGNHNGRGGGNGGGGGIVNDPSGDIAGRNSNGGDDDDDFDPSDVFVNPGNSRQDVPDRGADPPSADPDIPMSQPGTAGGGVRSRVGSMLRARPKTADSTTGPTALRN